MIRKGTRRDNKNNEKFNMTSQGAEEMRAGGRAVVKARQAPVFTSLSCGRTCIEDLCVCVIPLAVYNDRAP